MDAFRAPAPAQWCRAPLGLRAPLSRLLRVEDVFGYLRVENPLAPGEQGLRVGGFDAGAMGLGRRRAELSGKLAQQHRSLTLLMSPCKALLDALLHTLLQTLPQALFGESLCKGTHGLHLFGVTGPELRLLSIVQGRVDVDEIQVLGAGLPISHKSLLRAHREGQAKARGAANGRALGKHRNTGLALAVGSLRASRRWARRGVAPS